MTELPKTFDPAAIEAKWYAHWESTGAFRPSRPDAEPYTIVMPPPNVTGSLHIGHALDNTLPDILIRHARMCGKDALWVVGTDHAGIATQMVVERQMALQQQKRTDFTRDEFIAKVWEWKAESGSTITSQLRRLGASCDWENERFTMDEGFSKAVIKVFVDLYNTVKPDGSRLLYRDKRLVNWDPALKTAISDLEVETREVNGKFWHFKYPLEDGSGFISVATTRPETMLADMAVAVNPEDERYKTLVGKNVRLPITGRLIPIIADDHADPELGSGAVKITPGHDFNDFEVGKRAGFKAGEMLNMLDADGRVCQTRDALIPQAFFTTLESSDENLSNPYIDNSKGLDRFEARKLVIAMLDAEGLLEKIEDRVIQTPYGDRSGVVIEPWLTDQWYVDAATLAKPAIEAVRSGAIKVVPQSWEKTYFNWMENIQPWCVSRQLWWGHRIPVWYGPGLDIERGEISLNLGDEPNIPSLEVFVAESEQVALELAKERYSKFEWLDGMPIEIVESPFAERDWWHEGVLGLWQDSDVLDTWFSSALWPFGTLGWPDAETPPRNGEVARSDGGAANSAHEPSEVFSQTNPTPPSAAPPPPRSGEDLLSRHYPNNVLISGFDILFFWDARMIMQGLHFMKEVPWKTLYLHGLVRAADGSKMSKSKGNTVDPLGLIDQYGADALRFTLTAMESQGRDIKLDEKRVEGYRNFATKLWNAARFCQANGIGASTSVAAPNAELAVNRWIIGEVVETLAKLNQAIADLRFDAMADTIYHFAWGTFCDWYLELIKPAFVNGEKHWMDTESKFVAGWVFDQILVMLHPFMPFITEELWEAMGDRGKNLIIHAQWPESNMTGFAEAKAEIERLIEIVADFRGCRIASNIQPKTRVLVSVLTANETEWLLLRRYLPTLGKMLNLAFGKLVTEYDASSDSWSSGFEHTGLVESFEGRADESITSVRLRSKSLELIGLVERGFADVDGERTRITNAITAITKERDALAGRLNNPAFVEKAKPEAVEKARADHAEKSAEVDRLQAALARLG
jgi:valyl-tRNA synthetase